MSLMAPTSRQCADQATPVGLRRSVRLFRLFLAEQSDPEKFYSSLAEDAVQQVAEHAELIDLIAAAAPAGELEAKARAHKLQTVTSFQDWRKNH